MRAGRGLAWIVEGLPSAPTACVVCEAGRGGAGRRTSERLSDEHRRSDYRGPAALLVADGTLRDVLGADDLVRQTVDFFLLVPALVGIELQAERRGEHFGRQFLRIVPATSSLSPKLWCSDKYP